MDNEEVKGQLHAALNKAYFYLKFRPRSEKEVRDYLAKKADRWHWPQQVIDDALTSLKENNYVNDTDFVAWFVEQRSTGKPKSRFALSHELQRYGVAKDTVVEYFEGNPIEEEALAYEALRRRWLRYQHMDKALRFKKAAAFLSSRGFNFDIIKKAIQKMEAL